MKKIATLLALTSASSMAAIVTLSPGDINGLDTTTASFSNGEVTLTPLVGGVPDTFNAAGGFLGIDGNGTNDNAFGDADVDPSNGNEESLLFDFVATSGLSAIDFNFARAIGPGPGNGVIISGFLFDPSAAVTGRQGTPVFDAATQSIQISLFGDAANFAFPGTLSLDPLASAGQTLTLTVTDTTSAGGQFPITSISYDNAVPEPSSTALLGLGSLALLIRRRR